METMNNYNGVILIADLESKECETEDLSEELVEKALGGASINVELYSKYKERDPLILGSGFFTGTFMPCGCAGIMTAKSPVTGSICHVPFGLQVGVEFKLTGFDFLVILGEAANPVRLWLHDGLSDIDDSSDIWGRNVWESVDKVREAYGDEMIQMLTIGKAGENKLSVAQVSENYWGSRDKFGLAAVLGKKNIKAIAMRGLGALEVAEGFFQKAMELKNEIVNGVIKGKAGISDIAADLGINADIIEKTRELTHRHNAAFNCPYPAYTFLKYREAPNAMAMDGHAEPGCLVSDLSGFISLHDAGLNPSEAMEQCYRLGLEPTASGNLLKAQGASSVDALDNLAEQGSIDSPAPWPLENSNEEAIFKITRAFSNAVPPRGIFHNQGESPEWWVNRQALAYTLGLDPALTLMIPEITPQKVVACIQACAEWEDFTLDDLQRITSELIEKSRDA